MSFFDDLKQWLGFETEGSVYANVHSAGHSVVDYDIPLTIALAEANCDPNADITEHNFPPNQEERGKRELAFSFFIFGRNVSSGQVIRTMKKQRYRPATLRELLALYKEGKGAKYLVALGSSCCPLGMKKSPYYSQRGNSDKNYIGFKPYNEKWISIYEFLAVSERG